MDIELKRFAYTPQGTFGKLKYNDFECYTIERPWKNNIATESCIPEGTYTVSKYKSPKFGDVFILHGGTVSKFPDPDFERSAILIHPANVKSDLEGCIGLGDSLGYVKSQWAVLNSAVTLKDFKDKVGDDNDLQLIISFDKYGDSQV